MTWSVVYLGIGAALLLALGSLMGALFAVRRLRAEMRIQSLAIASRLEALLEARSPPPMREAVQATSAPPHAPQAPGTDDVRQDPDRRQAEWRMQLEAELHQMRQALQHPRIRPASPILPAGAPGTPGAPQIPLARAQAPMDPPPMEPEVSDEELDALPPELPAPRRRRVLPAPRTPPLRRL